MSYVWNPKGPFCNERVLIRSNFEMRQLIRTHTFIRVIVTSVVVFVNICNLGSFVVRWFQEVCKDVGTQEWLHIDMFWKFYDDIIVL